MRDVLGEATAHAHPWGGPEAPSARPVVTVSRQAGARGGELARALADDLGLHVYDREILQGIAQRSHSSESAVSALDERDRPALADLLASMSGGGAYLSPYLYFNHLTDSVRAIARLGGAVILGRGAHLILRPEQALRVFVVAPLAARVATVAEREGVARREAERLIEAAEAGRRAFLRRYFRAEFGDPMAFDLVVNTGLIGIEGGVDAVRGILAQRAPAAHGAMS